MWLPVAGMFVSLCVLVWLNEILDLPHLLLGAPSTPINWREALLETVLIVAAGLFVVLDLFHLIRRKRAEEALRETGDYLEKLLDYANAPIIVWDTEFKITRFNRAFERLTGYTADQVIGQELNVLFPDTSRDESLNKIERTSSGEYWESVEIPILRQDGDIRLVLWNSANIHAEDGTTILATIAQGTDITERKRAEEALRESEEKHRVLFETAQDAIFLSDETGRFVDINRAACESLGYSREELLELRNREIDADPRGYEAFLKARDGLVKGLRFEVNQRRKDGTLLPVEITESFFISSGQCLSLAVARDITVRKRAEKALRESEARYRLLAENVTDVIWTMDMNLRYTYVSPSVTRTFGYSVEETMSKTVEEVLTPASLEVALKAFAEEMAIEDREQDMEQKGLSRSRTLELEQYRKDDSTIWTELTVTGLRDPDGRLVEILGVSRDITERKRAEAERARLLAQIQEQAQQVQQIIDTMPEGVLLLDADGQVILANPVAEGDLAVLADAQVGDTLTHLGDRSLAELLTSPPRGLWHEAGIDGPPPQRFEIIARPLETGPTPGGPALSAAEGACPELVEGWVLVIRDVTREREIQQQAQQRERLAVVGQLAAGIAHDFNNIMATISLYAQMSLRTEELPLQDRERLVTINQQARHATNLIQQILDFSRHAVLERQPLDLSPLLKEHVELLKRTLPENIQVDLVYGRDEYTVSADPTRVQQVIMNLGLNARDAMPEGGTLRFGLQRIRVQPGESPPLLGMEAGDWVPVTVSDTGTGIPPDVLPHIFNPFFTTKTPGEGSGLGLAQVYGIVKQHEGEIGVESQVGQGTTFTIYLPALPGHPAEAPTRELPPLAKGQGETVLVAEDDRATREALVESLELLNYRALAAANGQEALAILERTTGVALVLSDVVMPRMGGIALLQALRQRGLAARMVMLTGHPLEKEMEDLRAQGVVDWLAKPPSLEQLAKVVARALNL